MIEKDKNCLCVPFYWRKKNQYVSKEESPIIKIENNKTFDVVFMLDLFLVQGASGS